jgi:cholesterol transport system auxiliary component
MLGPVKTEETTKYMLNVHPSSITKKKLQRRNTLMVTVPDVKPIFSTTDMLYSTSRFKVAAFAKNSWGDPPAQMLQPLIIQTMQNTHYFTAVVPQSTLGDYDFILSSQITDFKQIFFNRASEFHLGLRAQIISGVTGKVIASKEFSVAQRAPMNSPLGGVIAANCATQKLLEQLTAWYLQQNTYHPHWKRTSSSL